MSTIHLELVTPAKRILCESVDEVRAPGVWGSFGVLPGHADFVSPLRAGELVVVSGGQQEIFAIGEGYAQVSNNEVRILTEGAERAVEIDLVTAQLALEEERTRLAEMKVESVLYDLQRAKVEREAARVLVAGRSAQRSALRTESETLSP
jgi:F-type H+-transporting ATPase subunit epsilon